MAENIPFNARAGKKLLKICMGDIYPNPMVVYREYVQNSCDSLQEAERQGLFANNVQKTVSITINSNSISIHDRGIGVKSEDIITCLIDLSFSQKNGDNIGRYGIGRLTGAKYCDELVFETSAFGETKKSIVRFNAKKAREIIESDEEMECTAVVNKVTTFTQEDEKQDMHYFRVTMNNVFESHLLDKDGAKRYLAETVPVDFSSSFKDYLLKPAFDENTGFKDLYEKVPCCNVMLDGVSIKKLYESSVTNSTNQEERVGKIRFFKLENEEELLAWGWYAMTVTAKQFLSTVRFRKIRLRQLNMAVGDLTYFDNLYKKDADAPYFIGEIYATHPKIEPTTGREGLVDNNYKKIFEHKVKELFERLNKEYNELSKLGSQVLDPLVTNIRLLRIENKKVEVGLKTSEEAKENKSHCSNSLNEAKNKLADYMTKVRKNNRITDLVSGIVEYYQEISDNEIDKYNKQKDVQKANGQINKVSISNEIQKIMGEKGSSAQQSNLNSTNDSTEGNISVVSGGQTTSSSGTDNPEINKPVPSEFDPYKGLTSLEKSVIKKVYKILDSQKDLAPSIREKLKARMAKKLTKK